MVDERVEDTLGRIERMRAALRRIDSKESFVAPARALRRRLPGDGEYGDPLSIAGSEPPQLIGQRLTALTAERPSAMREVGLGALQVWQALSEAQGRGRGEQELTILFTDLVDFSSFTLEAGDTLAVELLRRVGQCVEPVLIAHGGRIVKRLGDGLMVVFADPQAALAAALEASAAIDDVEVGGHRPQLRAGLHVGKPRKLGDDYLGVDVNIAARVAAAAGPGEVLVSDAVADRIEDPTISLKRKWRFGAKGAPRDLDVFAVTRA